MKKEAVVSRELTYIGVFLTFHCGYSCSYCLNRHGDLTHCKELTAAEWIEGLNRLRIEREWMVPITLQGGEPSMHEGFAEVINGLRYDFYLDLLTNLDFDVDDFMGRVPPALWCQRNVPYPPIRVSYHPECVDLNILLAKALKMQLGRYPIGIYGVEHPMFDLDEIKRLCEHLKIDFRTKEFLGMHEDKIYGTYKYPEAVSGVFKKVFCKMTELLIAPDGNLHRCHRDLYSGENPLGNLMDDDLKIEFKFRECENFGSKNGCNPCDVKIKNNRFQEFGTCSAEIRKWHEGGFVKGEDLPCLLSR